MAIKSHAFGRVILTKEDAAKFDRQVRYGRSSKEAKISVERGLGLSEAFKRDGKVTLTVKPKKRGKVTAAG